MKRAMLITGGRDWVDEAAVIDDLQWLRAGDRLIVGDCRTGTDKIARENAPDGVRVEVYAASSEILPPRRGQAVFSVADWDSDGKAAGPIRNARMARRLRELMDEGCAVRAVGYPTHRSRGTLNCMAQVGSFGIEAEDHGCREKARP